MRTSLVVAVVILGLISVASAVVGVTAATSISTQAVATSSARPIPTVKGAAPNTQNTQAVGFPVLTPAASSVASTGLPAITPKLAPNSPSVPAIAESDVRSYFISHQLLRSTAAGPINVQSIEFLTTDAVNKRLNIIVDQPATKLLCLVTLTGDFTPHGPPGSSPKKETTAYVILDARTGNILTEIG